MDVATDTRAARLIASIRIILGAIFLWAFLDKTFGFGYTTPSSRAWLEGGNPTQGYLGSSFGPLDGLFHAMAGNVLVDFLFMLGLAGVGIAMILGIGVRVGGWAGFAMVLLMYLSHPAPWAEPNGTHPLLDNHVLQAAAFLLLAVTPSGDTWGLGRWWKAQPLVQKRPWLA